jgi:hypothetical protein
VQFNKKKIYVERKRKRKTKKLYSMQSALVGCPWQLQLHKGHGTMSL